MTKAKLKNKKNENSIVSFETFREIGLYEQSNLIKSEPTCFNGNLRIRKYKVTIELVEESNEILAKRLQKLWDECDNWHHWEPLKHAAFEIGYLLKGEPGSKRKK